LSNRDKNSRRDAEIAALHAIVVKTNQSPTAVLTGVPWWVFTSHTVSGEVIFTYKQSVNSPGGGWEFISPIQVDGFLYRLLDDGGHEVRAGKLIECPQHGYVRHADCVSCPDDSP
jgi:hypothetical protein